MYEKFFGFQRRPFDLVPDPDFLFLGESHDSALANLELGIESGKGFIVISGGVGIGKTTILRAVLRRIGREADVCYLNQPDLESTELLQTILDEFGIERAGGDKVVLRRRLRDFLEGRSRPAILVIDEAHLLSEESLEQVRLLSNFEETHRKLLQIVLAGQPELKELLSRARLRPLAQRIEMFYEIRPFSLDETKSYVLRRIQIAGNPESLTFESRALEEIHWRTGGVPRLINLLAERTLITAYVAGSGTIGAKFVREAFEDLGEVTRRVMGAGEPASPALEPAKPSSPPHIATATSDEKYRRELAPAPLRRRSWTPEPEEGKERGASRRGRFGRILAAVGLGAIAVVALLSLGAHHAMSSKPGRESKASTPSALGASPDEAGRSANDSPARETEAMSGTTSAQARPAVQALPAPSSASARGNGSELEPGVPGANSPMPESATEANPASSTRYAIQCGSFRDRDRAQELAWRLDLGEGDKVSVVSDRMPSGTWHRVLLGSFATQEEAMQRLGDVRAESESLVLQVVRLSSGESAPRPNENE